MRLPRNAAEDQFETRITPEAAAAAASGKTPAEERAPIRKHPVESARKNENGRDNTPGSNGRAEKTTKSETPTTALRFDMHAHLDFASNLEQIPDELRRAQLAVFSQSVLPRSFATTQPALSCKANILCGLGIHPWWITNDNSDELLEQFDETASQAKCFGEVGLDFSPRFDTTRDVQIAVLQTILHRAQNGQLLSLHAVKSSSTVIELLKQNSLLGPQAIFHCFSGSSQDLAQAMRCGCLFSVSKRMLASKRGREYARIIPTSQLLLESDLPSKSGESYDVAEIAGQLDETCNIIASLRGLEKRELNEQLLQNAASLFAEFS